MNQPENPIEANWNFNIRYYLSANIFTPAAVLLLALLAFFTSRVEEYKMIEIVIIVVCAILIVIYSKLNYTFVRQIDEFNYTFTERGLVVNQAKKVGLLFIKPKQTTTIIPYADIQKVYVSEPPLNFGGQKNIFVQFNNATDNSFLSNLLFYLNFFNRQVPGVWDNYLQIPMVKKENVVMFESKFITASKDHSPKFIYLSDFSLPFLKSWWWVNFIVPLAVGSIIGLIVSWRLILSFITGSI